MNQIQISVMLTGIHKPDNGLVTRQLTYGMAQLQEPHKERPHAVPNTLCQNTPTPHSPEIAVACQRHGQHGPRKGPRSTFVCLLSVSISLS